MLYRFFRGQNPEIVRRLTFIIVTAFLSSNLSMSFCMAGEPNTKRATNATQLRECLPVLLKKVVLQNNREYIKSLQSISTVIERLEQGGLISPRQSNLVKQAILRARITVVKQEAGFRNELEQLEFNFELTAKQLQKMEESVLLPLTRHFVRFEMIFRDYDAVYSKLSQNDDPAKALMLRGLLHEVFSKSGLVKNTQFRQDVAAQWERIEKLKDKELREFRDKVNVEHRKLLWRHAKLEADEKLDRRIQEIELQYGLAQFEQELRVYERRPWRNFKDKPFRQDEQETHFNLLKSLVELVLLQAAQERVEKNRKSWPKLAPLELDGIDLRTSDLKKAERIVTTALKKPKQVLAAKAKLRTLLAIADVYGIQQELFLVSLAQKRSTWEGLRVPSLPNGEPAISDSIGADLVKAFRTYAKVKNQLLTTWVSYQIARLDFYRELIARVR